MASSKVGDSGRGWHRQRGKEWWWGGGNGICREKESQNEKYKKIHSKPSFQAQRAKRGKTWKLESAGFPGTWDLNYRVLQEKLLLLKSFENDDFARLFQFSTSSEFEENRINSNASANQNSSKPIIHSNYENLKGVLPNTNPRGFGLPHINSSIDST